MTQATNPSCPEAVLLTLGERLSLSWIQFAIEELTPFEMKPGNGTMSLFVKLAMQAGWKRKEISSYLGMDLSKQAIVVSIHKSRDTESAIIREADAIIEKMILR